LIFSSKFILCLLLRYLYSYTNNYLHNANKALVTYILAGDEPYKDRANAMIGEPAAEHPQFYRSVLME